LTNREYIYRAAYQLGRHVIGYEVQAILALTDWLKRTDANAVIRAEGYGDGGLIAFYAAAADVRIDETLVAGYFGKRERLCDEPIDRNVFGLIDRFGDAEIASLIAPRTLIIVNRSAPELDLKSEKGGAPGQLRKQKTEDVRAEVERAMKLVEPFRASNWMQFEPENVLTPKPHTQTLFAFLRGKKMYHRPDMAARTQRILNSMDRHTQNLLEVSELTRRKFWKNLDVSTMETFEKSVEWYRNYFAQEVIGQFDDLLLAPNPRSRKFAETSTYTTYEVELEVFGGITVYGLLLIPKGIRTGEQRPVIVCQHGLERRPTDVLEGGAAAYSGFATVLCEKGYITFAPQNLYVLGDRFRFNQRQLNPLGKMLFSIMAPQHQQLTDWLGTLPFVDKNKIAFYGLSYGGKTAMQVPPLVKNYCLSICSAGFNSWSVKAASTVMPFSYIWSGEYGIFEFNLANTFDFSDMAKLIAPRPFMVERGYSDHVGWDEFVGYEYAKVRNFYDQKLKIPDRTEIHWFDGGHIINGEKTYPFLDRHLRFNSR
jgi:cephalosporin-C deacetylase-like acetyl esterase